MIIINTMDDQNLKLRVRWIYRSEEAAGLEENISREDKLNDHGDEDEILFFFVVILDE